MSLVHIHLLLNHVPVIGVFFAVVLFAAALAWRQSDFGKLTLAIVTALAVITVIVYVTGEPTEEALEELPGFSEQLAKRHEEAALLATVVMAALGALAALALVRFRARPLPTWVSATGLVGTLVVGGLMGWTANLGGQIRHTEIRPGAVTGGAAASEAEEEEGAREAARHG